MKVKNLIIEYSFFLIFDFSFGERWLHSFLQTRVTYNSFVPLMLDTKKETEPKITCESIFDQ